MVKKIKKILKKQGGFSLIFLFLIPVSCFILVYTILKLTTLKKPAIQQINLQNQGNLQNTGDDKTETTIYSLEPFYGKVGDSVILNGRNFGDFNEKNIFLGGTLIEKIVSWNDNQIIITIPEKAQSGKIQVKNAVSPYNFIVFSAGGGPAFGGDQKTTCEISLEKSLFDKVLIAKNCPVFSTANLILRGNDTNFDTSVKPGVSLPAENFKLNRYIENDRVFLKVVLINNSSQPMEKLLVLETAADKSLTIASVELWQNNSLIPLFVNPLKLTN